MSHVDPMSSVLFWTGLIFFVGLLGRYAAQRTAQPAVLGELLFGVLLGQLGYVFHWQPLCVLREGSATLSLSGMNSLLSPQGFEWFRVADALDIFSHFGVMFLLFLVGLETSVDDIKHTGRASFGVAVWGVVLPMVLGYAVTWWLLPAAGFHVYVFVAATLAATSVGITARVLKEMKKMHTREAKTIMGAAVIDDVLGLGLLAIVSGLVSHGQIDALVILRLIATTLLFFTAVLTFAPGFVQQFKRWFDFLPPWEAKLVTAFLLIMALSWLATCAQLAGMIGAFLAGLILHEDADDVMHAGKRSSIHDVMAPFEAVFAPLFFMLIGMQVKLEMFVDWHVLALGLALTLAAVVGKLMSGLGAPSRDDRWLIGVGMLPRGEVGLVFASMGRTLGVVTDTLFAAIILVVVITTFLAPIALKHRFEHLDRRRG